MISLKVQKTLEYDKILERLKKYAGSERAKTEIERLAPAVSYEDTSRLLKETAEADRLIHEYALNLSFAFDDVSFILERAEKMSLLTMDEVLKIGKLLRVSRQIKTAMAKVCDGEITLLKEKANLLYTDASLENRIFASIITPFEMSDNASPELRAARVKIKKCGEEIRVKLNRFITSPTYQKYLQDNVVTIRDNRRVILLKSEFKGAIPGLVHGQSATGSTLYVEPLEVFELNNRLKALLSDESFEIERVLREFTAAVCENCGFIRYGFGLATELDIIFAKAAMAKSMKAVRPNLNGHGFIDIIKGRHPLIDTDRVVPVSLNLGRDFNILMITGPNTGGKTVTLKLVGLFALMTQTGIFIPAHQDTVMGVFVSVFADIGDEQSIERSLSTFSSHMTNIVNILNSFDNNSLLLLDELGAGTDPAEGAAIALAVTEYIEKKGAKAVITTHYNELKEFSLAHKNVENASTDFDSETFAPTFKLILGVPGASNAVKIAEKLGLNKEITERADELIGSERRQFENIINAAERARKKAEAYLETAEAERADAERRLAEIRAERKRLEEEREAFNRKSAIDRKTVIENAADEAAEIIDEMKRLKKAADDAALFEAARLRKKLSALAETADGYEDAGSAAPFKSDGAGGVVENGGITRESGEIKSGDAVHITSLRVNGTVSDVSPGGATVKIGGLTAHIKMNDMFKIRSGKNGSAGTADGGRIASLSTPTSTESAPSEINLIGMGIDEAVYYVDNFIDRAVTGGLNEVRIIHGRGTGRLGKAIQRHLASHKNAAAFRYGGYGEGERGVTILTLK
ncbi:MAG: endonuclease MutS2 [Clostridiales bacterium]|jgi:DNA mismatch repair protein MutS2|nr:endonuclease MutS2 [Clostridiales bacterium]